VGIVSSLLLFVAWDVSTQFWLAVEIAGVRFQLDKGRFSIGWWFDGTLGWFARPSGDSSRSAVDALGLGLPATSDSPFGYRFVIVPVWLLAAGAIAMTWILWRGRVKSAALGSRSRWLRTWRQVVAAGALVLVLVAWWVSVRSWSFWSEHLLAEYNWSAGLGDGSLNVLTRTPAAKGVNVLMTRDRVVWALKKGGPFKDYYRVHRMPMWIVALGVGLLAGLIIWRDGRAIPLGHCQRCGYDLTKNESGICPECGVVIDGRTNQPVPPSAS